MIYIQPSGRELYWVGFDAAQFDNASPFREVKPIVYDQSFGSFVRVLNTQGDRVCGSTVSIEFSQRRGVGRILFDRSIPWASWIDRDVVWWMLRNPPMPFLSEFDLRGHRSYGRVILQRPFAEYVENFAETQLVSNLYIIPFDRELADKMRVELAKKFIDIAVAAEKDISDPCDIHDVTFFIYTARMAYQISIGTDEHTTDVVEMYERACQLERVYVYMH